MGSAPMGLRPTGLYGLIDLIGLDIMDFVGKNLAINLPKGDMGEAFTKFPAAEQAMLEPSDVTPEQSPADLGIDSLGLVESIFAIEEAFDISVPFNANAPEESNFDISSVAAIIAAVARLVQEQCTPA